MRLPLTIAMLMLMAHGAGAKAALSPLAVPPPAPSADGAIYLGPSGAMLEADYFHAPQPRYGASRIFPCRVHLRIAEPVRQIVQSCD